jgi:hypothetical protein
MNVMTPLMRAPFPMSSFADGCDPEVPPALLASVGMRGDERV